MRIVGQQTRFDVIVVGAGVIGIAMGAVLQRAGLRAAVIDRKALPDASDDDQDGRAWAIAAASRTLLERAGVWAHVRESQPILEIRVSDGHAPVFLHYDHRAVGDEPLGEMVYAHDLTVAAADAARAQGLAVYAPAEIVDVARNPASASVTLADGTVLTADLLVAADGRNSYLRRSAGIDVAGFAYGQGGIVCTIAHERPHNGIAHERFLAVGPFAILPLPGGQASSLVWTEPADLIDAYLECPEADFVAQIAERVGGFLGDVSLVGPRFAYPLSLQLAHRYTDRRLALVGDAAHVIHPIAGQGLNLGLRDVAALAEQIIDAARLGLDVGGAAVLPAYNARRVPDTLLMAGVTDVLNRLFSNSNPVLGLGRDAGLAAVNRLPGLKNLFMRHAMGRVGVDRSRLMQP